MALWFSATAAIPELIAEWQLDSAGAAWLTMSVQIGFVAGTFLSAFFNLPDVYKARYLFAVSALAGALFNSAVPLFSEGLGSALVFRFMTGMSLAGVYPPGMKLMAMWFRKGRGMAIGMLVGALTVGSALPHLFRIIGAPGWRQLMHMSSAASICAGLICVFFVREGPYLGKSAPFNWRFTVGIMKNRNVRLANFGYLGHMWELYAVWTWIPLFLRESFTVSGLENVELWSAITAFSVIAVGGAGSIAAGFAADRIGRPVVTIWSLVISGLCCVVAGLFFGGSPAALTALCLVWGFAVVADSAQFSAAVTELTDPDYAGTALTLQTCMGFLITMVSIRFIPAAVELLTWRWAFMVLAVGPIFGIVSMYRLKSLAGAGEIRGTT
ncbi:MFS transporter [candidate division KSB1 bacterium]